MRRDRRIRIVYCENNVDGTVGGSYYSLLYLVKGLDRTRYEPIVIFYTHHSLLPAFRDAGIETQVWPRAKAFSFGARVPPPLRRVRTPLLVLQKALNVLRTFLVPALVRAWFLATRGVSIVHLNNSVLYNHDWMLAARLARKTCLTHERGINDRYPTTAKYFSRRLDAVICISDAVRDNMRERGADFGNLVTIHNGLDPQMMRRETPPEALRAALGLTPADLVVCMIGNIKAWKGQDTLIRAMDRVRRVLPQARSVLVGDTSPSDRAYEETLRALVASLDLERHVVFAGFQRNVTDFLMMCDAMVHASVLPEPFGRVILEAMACRKPVIGSRAGAIPEIVEEGRTGLTFPPGDAERLAEAIVTVVTDRSRAARMGERGYDRLVREFHVARNVEATQRTYESLLRAAS
ncbi:MAG: glycosyltransferase family 4 protein [Gammaproteobacteria bacterium]